MHIKVGSNVRIVEDIFKRGIRGKVFKVVETHGCFKDCDEMYGVIEEGSTYAWYYCPHEVELVETKRKEFTDAEYEELLV